MAAKEKFVLSDVVLQSIVTLHDAVVESCSKTRPARPRKRDIIPGRAVTTEDVEEEDDEWVCKNCNKSFSDNEESRWIVCDSCDSKFHLECTNVRYAQKNYWTVDLSDRKFNCCKGRNKKNL